MQWLTRFFRKQKKNWQKIKQMLSNTLRLNFFFLKIICVLHSRYHPGVVWHIAGNGQGGGCLFSFHGIVRLVVMGVGGSSGGCWRGFHFGGWTGR